MQQSSYETGPPRLEDTLERMRPCFELPGIDRYLIAVRRGPLRFGAVYDIREQRIVTLYPINLARHRPPMAPDPVRGRLEAA